jgi:hypothetical protein
MDPISAMAFSLIVSWLAVNAAWEAGVDQAKAEARHTAEAIRKDLHQRRKAWAKQLEKRLADGRKGGPATAIWWGWAAMRTAKGIRRLMRKDPREAEKQIGGPTGPFQRIFTAAWRGAKYARDEARRQRETHEKKTPREPVGVCGRCGAVTAKKALAWALTRFDRQEQMCATCRAKVAAERKADEDAQAAKAAEGKAAGEPADFEPGVVHDSDEYTVPKTGASSGGRTSWIPPRREGETPPTPRHRPEPEPKVTVERADQPSNPARPAPIAAAERPELETGRPSGDSTEPEGADMPRQLTPARGGTVATRNAAMTRRSGGDSYTHGQWHRATTDMQRRLDMLPVLLEAMLRSLRHEDAGRTQVAGVMAIYEAAVLYLGALQDMLRIVSAKERPMVDAVTVAGGPDEIPNLGYFREI